MRFVLYNVRYAAGTGRSFHFPCPWGGYLRPTHKNLGRIIGYLKDLRPDIVGLVEVDAGSYRTRRTNQAEVMAEALGHYHSYAIKYGSQSLVKSLPVFGKQGNAFLTSDVIEGQRFHYFEHGVKRLVIELELKNMVVFLVHLSLKFRHRHHQMDQLYALVKQVRKPHIVAGDFNAFWGDREMRMFLEATGLRSANERGLPSYPSWNPKRQLDFVLYSKGLRVNRFEVPSVRFSDHLPLVCDFDV